MYNWTSNVRRASAIPLGIAGLATVSILCATGCIQEETVITTTPLQDEHGTWIDCFDDAEFFDFARHGDPCDFGDNGSNGSNSGCFFGQYCVAQSGSCIDGKLAVSDIRVADCAEAPDGPLDPEPRPDMSWADCASALEGGQTGEACTGGGWACARAAADPCCQEVAYCEDVYSASGTLILATTCATDCTAHGADDTRETVTDCASAVIARPNDPCTGDFSCAKYTWPFFQLRWCDAGALRVHGQVLLPAVVMEITSQ